MSNREEELKKSLDTIFNMLKVEAEVELRAEIYKEVFDRKEKKILYTEKAKQLYDKFKYENPIVLKMLKKELPLSVRLFNKITVIGSALLYEDIIQYTYCFNDDWKHVFVYKPYISDMERWK